MNQTKTGVSETGYPGHPAQSTDPESPALSASTEQKFSRPEPGEHKGGEEAKHEHPAETK